MQTIKSRSIKSDRIRRCNQWNPFRTWSRHESSDDPDIVQDTSKVDDILFGKCESLLEFAEILQGVTLDIEETQK